MLVGTKEQLKELFLSEEKTFRKERIVSALSPKFLSYLDNIEGACMMTGKEKPLVVKLLVAFTGAYSSFLTKEELAMYIDHKFLKPDGYFYELARWYVFLYYDLSNCESVIAGKDEFTVANQCSA